MPPTPAQAAQEQLVDHRLRSLEDGLQSARQAERDTDHLKIELAHTNEVLTEFKAEVRERDKNTQASLARLHQRFDELSTADAREDGARTARIQMWKTIWVAAASSAGVASAIVALLALLFHH